MGSSIYVRHCGTFATSQSGAGTCYYKASPPRLPFIGRATVQAWQLRHQFATTLPPCREPGARLTFLGGSSGTSLRGDSTPPDSQTICARSASRTAELASIDGSCSATVSDFAHPLHTNPTLGLPQAGPSTAALCPPCRPGKLPCEYLACTYPMLMPP